VGEEGVDTGLGGDLQQTLEVIVRRYIEAGYPAEIEKEQADGIGKPAPDLFHESTGRAEEEVAGQFEAEG